jgi:hypothetical protein
VRVDDEDEVRRRLGAHHCGDVDRRYRYGIDEVCHQEEELSCPNLTETISISGIELGCQSFVS